MSFPVWWPSRKQLMDEVSWILHSPLSVALLMLQMVSTSTWCWWTLILSTSDAASLSAFWSDMQMPDASDSVVVVCSSSNTVDVVVPLLTLVVIVNSLFIGCCCCVISDVLLPSFVIVSMKLNDLSRHVWSTNRCSQFHGGPMSRRSW